MTRGNPECLAEEVYVRGPGSPGWVSYCAFVRTWWRKTPTGLVPGVGRKKMLARGLTLMEAHAVCQRYNASHDPGLLSRKAEFGVE
jgi:hypothetical protein